MKRLQKLWDGHWRLYSCILLGAALLCFALLYHLGSLTPGLSPEELRQQSFSSSWHHLWHNPLYAPLTVLQWLILTIFSHHGSTVARAPSILLGFWGVVAFAYVLRRWYGVRTATFGTLIFASSAWFLHVSRYGGTEIVYLWAVPTLLAALIAWERYEYRSTATVLMVLLAAAMLYIPGLVWLLVAALILQPYHVGRAWSNLPGAGRKTGLAGVFALMLIPLIIAVARNSALLLSWLGLPHHFTHPAEVPRRFAQTVTFFVWRGPVRPELWLDRLPILSAFGVVMALLGVIFYARHLGAPRTRLLLGMFVVGGLLYSLGYVPFSILVPTVYLVVTGGVGYLLHEWLRVFPRNPIARAIGYTLLTLVILLSCAYNLRSYFIAWPHSTSVVSAFHHRP